MSGGILSLYDIAPVRLAVFWLLVRSETPPDSMVTFLGCIRFSNDVFSVEVSVMVMVSFV